MQLKGSVHNSFTQSHSHTQQRYSHNISSRTDSHAPQSQDSVFIVSKRDRRGCAPIATVVAAMNIFWQVAESEVPGHRVEFS